jgi:CheY-like chemotaxis protein
MKDGKRLILCVDDDKTILDSLRVVLEAGGYRMADAATAEEAFRKYEAEAPDLVILDLMMEEIDSGTSLVTKLRAIGGTAPVFLLSSIGDQLGRTVDPAQLGFAGVFQKPIDAKALLATLKTRLGT